MTLLGTTPASAAEPPEGDPIPVAGLEPAEPGVTTSTPSPLRAALEQLRHDRVVMISAGVLVFFVLVAVLAPVLAAIEGASPTELHPELVDDYGLPVIGPTAEHWFGVEPRLGRDLFARWAYGARPSLIIAVVAGLLTTSIGVTVGIVAGLFGGWVDQVIGWFVDFLLAVPGLLLIIGLVPLVSSWLGPEETRSAELNSQLRLWTIVAVFGLLGWPGLARLIRGQVLSLREREYVLAARALGLSNRHIIFRELLPNLTAPIIVSLSLTVPALIAGEAGLSFLGVGLVEPTASWGRTIADATNYYAIDPLYLWIPAGTVLILVLALSMLADGIRDALDPRTQN